MQRTQNSAFSNDMQSFQTSNVSQNLSSESTDQRKVTPMYYANIVEKYNRAAGASRRLNNPESHEGVIKKTKYCSLSSYNLWSPTKGDNIKKGGAKAVQ